MIQTCRHLLAIAFLALAATGHGMAAGDAPTLPDWQVLEFEEKAFWATARSRLELLEEPQEGAWEFSISSSVVGNSEDLSLNFEPDSGKVKNRERLSKGKEQRFKSFAYNDKSILRERRIPGDNPAKPPAEWPLTSRITLSYPDAADSLVVTNPHLLILLAQRLQAQGPGSSMEVLVHTDFNFYRVRLTCGEGIPISASYAVTGKEAYSGKRETTAVALQVSPEGELAEKEDFSLLGLEGEIILFFDKTTGLPLQVRGTAPRIGATDINLKSVTMRPTER